MSALPLIVKKFGGTSVGDVDHIRNAAQKVAEARGRGDEVVVVVSAMSGVTNQLVEYCQAAAAEPAPRESDAVLATGEQVTAGLMAIALQGLGVGARSWSAWQIPLRAGGAHGAARVEAVELPALRQCLEAGLVPVIAGFQGLMADGSLATLGRGGSDLSAVEVAAALKALRCDIYTDVPGVYTADPNLVPAARKLSRIGYGEMAALSRHGAKVLQPEAVESAMAHGVPVRVLSSLERQPGTELAADVSGDGGVAGIAYREKEDGTVRIAIVGAGIGAGERARPEPGEILAAADVAVSRQALEPPAMLVDVPADKLSLALRALHSAYGLGQDRPQGK